MFYTQKNQIKSNAIEYYGYVVLSLKININALLNSMGKTNCGLEITQHMKCKKKVNFFSKWPPRGAT